LAASGISSGAVFRGVNRHGKPSRRGLHKDCVGWILKRAASRAGLKPEPLGGHCLRAGHVTQAAMNGVSERDIMRQTGHKSAEMLARYIRIGEIFTRNAAAGLGI
jgi:integrase